MNGNAEFSTMASMASMVRRRFGFISGHTFTPTYASASSRRIRMAYGCPFSPASLLFRSFGWPWPDG